MEKNYLGVMLDVSRNGVMKPEKVKEFVDLIAKMGYNMLELYTEDTFEVNNEPYFGYLRGRYSKEELKDLDAYCTAKGIELMPCVQTLAHLNQIFQWQEYKPINDTKDILLVEEERTYELIDNIFSTIKECFKSRTVHIGMDEAHDLGFGKIFNKNGFIDKNKRAEIMVKHLNKVLGIAKKYGFKCMMWSDMFFRLANNGEYFVGDKMPKEVVEEYPKEVALVYWDYYHREPEHYASRVKLHKILTDDIWFAGGACKWQGFTPFNRWSTARAVDGIVGSKSEGVKNAILTIWGDDGNECPFFSIIPTLYAFAKAYNGVTDEKQVAKDFFSDFNEDYFAFQSLDLPNRLGDLDFDNRSYNPIKYLFYNDLFSGKFDTTVRDYYPETFRKYSKIIKENGEKSNYKYLFDVQSLLCDVLEIKCDFGVRLRKAYKSGKKEELEKLLPDFDELVCRLEKFYTVLRTAWLIESKPNGLEVQDARIGGLIMRVKNCKALVLEYLAGKKDALSELNEDLLDYHGKEGNPEVLAVANQYVKTFTPNVPGHNI